MEKLHLIQNCRLMRQVGCWMGVLLMGSLSLQAQTILAQPKVTLVEVGDGYSQTSVNTAVFRNSSLTTHGDEQYICYYDAEGCLVLGKRKLDSDQWILHRTQYKGNVRDAHNVISMKKPMTVKMWTEPQRDDVWICVANAVRPKQGGVTSGKGLENLSQRYRLLCGKEIVIEQNEKEFIVKLPLLYDQD